MLGKTRTDRISLELLGRIPGTVNRSNTVAKSVTFNAVKNRIQFKCRECSKKRNMTIPPNIRMKSIRCQSCGELTRSIFNRRVQPRGNQSGLALLRTHGGKEINVMLQDISPEGVGFSFTMGSARTNRIKLGHKVRLECSWSPRLVSRDPYTVQNINGQRVGLKVR